VLGIGGGTEGGTRGADPDGRGGAGAEGGGADGEPPAILTGDETCLNGGKATPLLLAVRRPVGLRIGTGGATAAGGGP
jgi:hypothetical protein